ncbi:MAG TPA: TraR/DksA family transcriptional regulator [Gammaproteobacteria bacterium]|nr:TraR/DksA family transcriptional regulator [Gammaproteobacteria bacterium]
MLASNLERHHLAGFRQQLGVRAADLRRRITAVRDDAALAVREVNDTKDQASADAAEEVRFADLERDRAELADVEQALARIDAGTYGMCCDCGRPIGRRRLEAYPTAKRCRDCQEQHEQHRERLRH